jgi:hypothetical protein
VEYFLVLKTVISSYILPQEAFFCNTFFKIAQPRFYKLREIDKDLIEKSLRRGSDIGCFKNDFGGERKEEITFKKWDKRWRVNEE